MKHMYPGIEDAAAGTAWPADILRRIELDNAGIVFGAGTRLAPLTKDGCQFVIDRERIIALLSVAYGKPVSEDIIVHLKAASAHWQRGDRAVAGLRLIFARLPPLADPADAYRMRMAEYLLDEGITPRALMKELGLDSSLPSLAKFDPNQPRVPAGNGIESGRWSSGESTAAFVGTVGVGRSFLVGASPESVAALASLVARFAGPAAFLLAMVIPAPNDGGVTRGTLPGAPDVQFVKDGPTGTLRLTSKAADGSDVLVVAENRGGLYVDVRTDQAIGRDFGSGIYLDTDAVDDAIADAHDADGGPDERSKAAADEPKLCPEPSDDVPNNPSARAKAYQEQISALNNPQRPLKWGTAVGLNDPETGKRVVYDDCRESDGTMIEAKGPGYGDMLQYSFAPKRFTDDWTKQGREQVNASGGRNIDWFFADANAANLARKVFDAQEDLRRIRIFTVPAVMK